MLLGQTRKIGQRILLLRIAIASVIGVIGVIGTIISVLLVLVLWTHPTSQVGSRGVAPHR